MAHINEPTRPITRAYLQIYEYQRLKETGIMDDADEVAKQHSRGNTAVQLYTPGGELPVWRPTRTNNLRIEGVIEMQRDWPDQDAPSEHYDVRLEVFDPRVVNQGRDVIPRLEWGVLWKHQNIKPHNNGRFSEPFQATQWNIDRTGTWRIECTITGWESGNVFDRHIEFVVPEDVLQFA